MLPDTARVWAEPALSELSHRLIRLSTLRVFTLANSRMRHHDEKYNGWGFQ
jgi:response regulator RpfG family c-di-GMP phosphodiesterase